ncbi:uncharacterized protein BP01DRAFT_360768 [Aspergillus saccharolyticus JOP 1030-1]|uniref:Uncharacterized protein n=1 Tax=Aspergillus saccharolyticus JOP 1030-1 TaxID=1450539 RepID=A0A318Z1U0_9EURO|nr:hypothetical protein BP01DRAFT_360768 [Aspergillus saccharolyticus JOP 1030-1]PYH41006.1 hypothetical protein BP01DRAFT_360768 [Aspergillus saccharolyticus JOP 1030-1]
MSSSDRPSVSSIPLQSEKVKIYATEAWKEVKPVAESLPRPKRSTIARFFATDACDDPINYAISEYTAKGLSQTKKEYETREILSYKKGGLVVFPGKAIVGQTFTIMIPLEVCGEVYMEGLALDTSHYYHIFRECSVEVSEGAKLTVLVISDLT